MPTESGVLRLAETDVVRLAALLARFGLQLRRCRDSAPIPASFWGDDEAGIRGNCLYARDDTPLHSILHEACHFICVDPVRRMGLDTDAGSDDAEECAVCYLQILLADEVDGLGRERMWADMDSWGYSFRLGSSQAWFEHDAADALAWLIRHDLVDAAQRLRFAPRQA